MMRVNHTEEEILLDRSGVDHISDLIHRWLDECRVSKRDNLRVQFAMEDQLLNICEHFEEKANVLLSPEDDSAFRIFSSNMRESASIRRPILSCRRGCLPISA